MSAADAEVNVHIASDYDDEGSSSALNSMQELSGSVRTVTSSMMLMNRESFMMTRAHEMEAMSANRVANAQMVYNDAVAKFGPNSEQAMKAHNNLANAQIHQQRTMQMLEYEQRMFILRSIPMMMSGITGLVEAFDALDEAENLAVGLMQVAASGAQLAVAGYTLYQATQMAGGPGAGGAPTMHGGGVVPSTGQYTLQAGETVNAGPIQGGGGGSSGDTYHIHVSGAMNAEDMANQIMDAIERRKRTKFPVNSRTY